MQVAALLGLWGLSIQLLRIGGRGLIPLASAGISVENVVVVLL
jgi:hypothetical protein